MYKSKVISLYNTLSQEEKKALQKFIHSPLHNQHSDVTNLIDYLSRLKRITSENTDRNIVHKEIFKSKPFQESNIRHVSSYLFKSIEDFIVYRDNLASDLIKYKSLIKFYREKGLTNLLESTIKKLDKLEETSKPNSHYFLEKYCTLNEIALANEQMNRTSSLNFSDILDYLDKYYLAEKLKQSSNMLSHQSVFGKDYSFSFMDALFELVNQKGLLNTPSIAIHYYNFLMVKEPEEESYFKSFIKIMMENAEAFEAEELKDLYVLAINYNLRKANKGGRAYPKKVFDLYKLGLENKALLPFGNLSPVTYKNIINTALYLKENAWALKFIHEYKDFLDEDMREDMFNYNLAHYYCKIDDFESSLRILATVDLKDENYNSRGKVLQLKMHYESEEYEVLESLLDSFWIYLKRKKHLGYRRDLWLKLIKHTRSIIHTKPGDHSRLKKILNNIKEEKDLMEKKWLVEKVEELLSHR